MSAQPEETMALEDEQTEQAEHAQQDEAALEADGRVIHSGTWNAHPDMQAYRAEKLSGLLVERVKWEDETEPRMIGATQVAGPGYVWFRFWLPESQQIVEKYFDEDGNSVGIYMPVCEPIKSEREVYRTVHLWLGLWLAPSGHVMVMNEDRFDEAVHSGEITTEQATWAEMHIRELTAEISREKMPPPLIRNFAIRS
jgi:predicted RNA-binding protein associated with RNAse of E/G family